MLPKLLYVGDVPVEDSYHGSVLLYRLLADYPSGRLTILETAATSQPERRLQRVNYISHPIANQRWLNTRFHPYVAAWFTQRGTHAGSKISQAMNGFKVESVLTVAHGFGWLAAADIARRRKVPLHLMVHDDWPRVANVPATFRKSLDERFASVYRQAQSRLCVSPSMSRAYHERYDKAGDVIYPSRAVDCPEFADPPERLARNDKPFTIAFAGTINANGYIQALVALQDAVKRVNGRLLIFGPLTADAARQAGLDDPNTELCGLLNWAELMTRLREEADALFLPMSFDACDRANMEMGFPSKLADYTATGLPLLIFGPTYCSAVVWARENPGVAKIVIAPEELPTAVEHLATDPNQRLPVGKRGLEVGKQYFTHERVQQVFHQVLSTQSP